MGIPRFIVPVESDATSKATEKAAAQSRSTIRRQRTIRGGEGRRRRWLSMVTDSNNEASENRRSSSSSNSEQEETRDILSYERYRLSRSGSDDQSMPPVPESRDYEDRGNENTNFMNNVRRRQRQRDEQHVRELMAHSRASRDPARRIAQPGSAQPWVSNRVELSPTPEASPPRHTVTDADELRSRIRSMRRDATRIMDSLSQRRRALEQDESSGPHATSRSRLDGLGDRNRSLSPAEWDTLLVGITPDPQPPSAGSSFASSSASAAAVSSSPSPNPTASTTMTSPERSGESDAARDCDNSEPSSNEEDDYSSMPELEDVSEPVVAREPDAAPPASEARARWRQRQQRLLIAARVERINRLNEGADARRIDEGDHMDSMHRIISGLAGRQDIPDEWWARAGLRRGPMS